MKATPVATVVAAVLALGAAGFAPHAQAADKDKKQTVSPELAKTLKSAQEALQAKKYSDALAKLKDAEANPKKSPYDEHVINLLAGQAYAQTKDYPNAAKVIEATLDDGFLDQAEVPKRVEAVAQIEYQLKNYDKAIEYGNRAIKGGFADDDMLVLVGQAYYLKGDWKGTEKFEESQVDGDLKAGKTPKDQTLQLLLSACIKNNDQDCQTRTLEKLVAYYPKTEYWQQLLFALRQATSNSDRASLQTYRLMSEVDILKDPSDYTEMAQLAIEQGSPGEAQHVLEKGFSKNVFTDAREKDKNTRLLESAKKAAAADQAQLPKMEADAKAAATGDKDVAVGYAYLGYGQYDKAAAMLSDGLTKGGVKNEAEARLLLGIAQLKGGHKDDAVKSFHAVKGDPNLERLANLWTLHAKQA